MNNKKIIKILEELKGDKTNVEFAKEIGVHESYLTDVFRHRVLRNGKYKFAIYEYINKKGEKND